MQLGQERRVEEAGFSFRPPAEYAIGVRRAIRHLSAAGPASGAVMLRADPAAELLPEPADSLGDAFASFVAAYTAGTIVADEAEAVRVDGNCWARTCRTAATGGFAGNVVMTEPAQDRLFIMVGLAPVELGRHGATSISTPCWIPSLSLRPAQRRPPLRPLSRWRWRRPQKRRRRPRLNRPKRPADAGSPVADRARLEPGAHSNSNFVNRLALLRSTVWARPTAALRPGTSPPATMSSSPRWTDCRPTGSRPPSIVRCRIGHLVRQRPGLQVFDTEGGSWKTLSSANSPMSFDDIVALHCDVEAQMLIVAYTRHGLDIFDVAAGEWTHVDENDGLETGIIRDIAVTAPQTIWLASQLGLTRFSDGESTLYNVENSPMTSNVVTAIAGDGADIVWLATAGDLYRIDGESWETYSRATVADSEFPNGSITGLALAADGSVWIGTDQVQLCRLDADAGRCAEFFSNEEGMALAPLTSLRLDEDGNVYYTTAGAGISMYDGERC